MLPAAWWADEMLGRLARYMRMVGLDTAYVPGLSDDEVLRRAREEGRVVLTRDRSLARRAPRAVLLTTVQIQAQWTELRRRFPEVPNAPRFLRCTLCNGPLEPELAAGEPGPALPRTESRTPRDRVIYRCRACGHAYWEGSHTDAVRSRLARWGQEAGG